MSIRMSNEMRELRVKLGNALDAIDAAVAKGDAEAATKAKEEADRCRSLLTAAENAFDAGSFEIHILRPVDADRAAGMSNGDDPAFQTNHVEDCLISACCTRELNHDVCTAA